LFPEQWLVLKKCKRHDDVLFINAAGPENFEKGERQNRLLEDHITKVLDTYRERKEKPRYSRRVGMNEIRKNEMNLNISPYVRTAEPEAEIDLAQVHAEIVTADAKIKAATAKHNQFLKELGLPLLP
jgi:type I restriction enzyme M protein